jgi:hypothetical protein
MGVDEKVEGSDHSENSIDDCNTHHMYQVYSFKDLKPNEYFIIMPTPGDNKGHGGYLGAHRVFKKINATQAMRYHLNPVHNVIFNFDAFKRDYDRRYKQNIAKMSKDMHVIKVD